MDELKEIMQFITNNGFAIVMAILMYKQNKDTTTKILSNNEKIAVAMDDNTKSNKELSSKIDLLLLKGVKE